MHEILFGGAGADDIGAMLDWAAAEGWNPGLEDADAFQATDQAGFFVARIAGRPVAAISVVNHCDDFAFLGLYICRPAYRGQGIGLRLWTHALDHAGGRTVGLDGVAAQQGNYAKSGFVLAGATLRFQGQLDPAADRSIRLARPGDAEALGMLDLLANGFARPAFTAAWTAQVATRKTVVLDDGAVRGFATVRACREGCKIGPVIAPDAQAAVRLARAALVHRPGAPAIIDVPGTNAALVSALTGLGFVETFATARMYRGTPPVRGPGLQAIATMELG